jgi:hypothetical protein
VRPCTSPVPFETLVAWYAHELSESDADALEQHLFACDACAAASEELGLLIGGLREVIPPAISSALRERLAASGHRILFTPCTPDATATARFAPDVDLMVHALRGDLSRAERVDVEILGGAGDVRVSLEEIPFERDEVLLVCQRHYRHMFGEAEQPTFRVLATEGGEKRKVGDYLVIHIWE